ncbi:MAG TPA: peptide ABC transporter substrate-binding protein [Kouleothrix sp.]|uniref:peptide ABC transporter substrate-binding protein n=1 Tax=Kouleothrix sp. TaxID=2779161 RepID=UPI002CDF8318|nr:peptide ABC transporter substrate-binding protein [Kouleothrix sp.]HRC74351.1 peptide ABC transporter substrate-binding protein [Kouleothrix sp.]
MARRIRWQILIAAFGALLVLGLMGYLAVTRAAVLHPLAGGAYVEGLPAVPQQLNPLLSDAAADPAAADLRALLFDGLMRIGADGRPELALAQSVIKDDAGQVYTFTLRSDVAWHDGTPLSIDDVLFTLRAIQNRSFAGDPSVSVVWRDVLVDQVGERSVRCTLAAPFAPFLSVATFPILPAHLLGQLEPADWASAPFNQKPVGTGPYRLIEINSEHALLNANPAYFGGRPFIDALELRFYASSQLARTALARGEIQGLGLPGSGETSLSATPRGDARHAIPLDSAVVLGFNLRRAPLNDQGLRRALAEGLDKDTLLKQTLDGQAARLDTPILPGWWAALEDPQWYAPNPQRAADTLDTLGYSLGPDGIRTRDGQPLALPLLTLDDPDRLAVANEIARQWRQIGVRVDVQPLDAETLRQRLAAHDFTMALYGLQRLGADPDVYELWHSSQADAGTNYAGLRDDQVDQLLADGRRESDEARIAIYRDFQRRWVELAPSIMLYQPLFIYTAPVGLEGLDIDQANAPADIASSHLLLGREGRFRGVTRWFIRSAREIQGELR